MGIVVDLIIIAVLLMFIFIGYKKGLTGSLIKLLSFIIALILAFVLYKPVASMIIKNTQMDENIKITITNTLGGEKKTNTDAENKMPSKMVENITSEIENATEEAKTVIIDETAKTIINVTSGIIVFIAVRLILVIVSLFVNQITKLPIIKQVDKIGGIAYGAIEGLIIVYIILSIISLTSVIWSDNVVVTAINKSVLGEMLYNHNFIINFIFK